MTSHRIALNTAAFLVGCLALAGCVTAGASPNANSGSTNPQSSDLPAVVATDSAGNYIKSPDLAATHLPIAEGSCFVVHVQATIGPRTVAAMAAMSPDIIVGTFQGFGPSRWNTPDGTRPTSNEFNSTSARLVRSVSIGVQTTVRGAGASASQAIVRGGQLGCDVSSFSDSPSLTVGSRYVFFLVPVGNSMGGPSSDLLVLEAWPIDANGTVQTREDGAIPLSQISTAATQIPFSTAGS